MNRHAEIQVAYHDFGKEATFYDGMITCSTLSGRAVCKLVWNMNRDKNNRYLDAALAGISADFSGELLEVPVGTGVLTMPVYQRLPQAQITCLDYSEEMMAVAKRRAKTRGLDHIRFTKGDIGALPFADKSFDLVLSLNGFHAFPDKEAAYQEVWRVLKPGGTFCGCFYIKGENKRTDWLIKHIYIPKGFFTPPFETMDSLRERLSVMYEQIEMQSVESMACFNCRKSFR